MVALASCGGSGSEKSATKATSGAAAAPTVAAPAPIRPARSKASYVKAANRICRRASSRLAPLHERTIAVQKVGNPTVALKRFGTVTEKTATLYDDTVGELQALGAPSGDPGRVEQLNAFLAQLAAITHQLSDAATAQDRARVAQLSTAAGKTANHYTSAARAYGLRSCGGIAQLAVARRGNR